MTGKIGTIVGPSEPPAMIHLSEKQLPQIKTWKLGGKYKLIVETEMTNHGKGSYGDIPMSGDFKVLSVKSAGQVSEPAGTEVAPSKEAKVATLSAKAQTA